MKRYVKGLSGKILDTYKQAIKYGMSVEEYWEKFSFPNCECSDNLEDLIPEVFIETCDLEDQTASVFNESKKVEYLINRSKKTPEKAVLKLVEETGELVSALEALDSYKKGTLEHVQEEAVDVLQCAMSVYFLIQKIKPFDGASLMRMENEKWEYSYLND